MTPLYAAVCKGNIELVKLLLSNDNTDVNYLNDQYKSDSNIKKTALYTAVEKGDVEIVRLLLENKNIDVNIVNEDCEYEVVEDDDGYPAQEEHNNGKAALHLAAQKGNVEIVRLLLTNRNVDVNVPDGILFFLKIQIMFIPFF